ncbi:phosphoserine phosphatase SerB [Rheinheimera sp. D18]|uniref:phosphoserine phosphatase SerB n=1 Tax=Rheinheimera sp. D18 TaxID=2545632 RepID=UPI0010439FEB|nr:phosphoserine phosphatase SerB [Rheinheimera sp. D18]QBL09981.1 phosphoserine phosphatase SerB [Rheinheimera sp. D18]
MAVLPSIGTFVSFFYQVCLAQPSTEPLFGQLAAGNNYQLKRQKQGLALHAQHVLPLQQGASFVLNTVSDFSNVIRLFGTKLNWSALAEVLQIVVETDATLACRVYQPHKALTGALELQLKQPLTFKLQQQLNDLAARLAIEVVYLPVRPILCQPGLLVMDMDSTAIAIECIDEIAKLAGVGEQVAAVTARAMNGELDFTQSLTERVALLAGAPEQVLQQVLATLPLMPGLTELVAHLKAHSWQVAIASGGFTYFTNALQQQLGLTATFANVLEIIDGKLTGKVLGNIIDANAKARVVQQLATAYNISHSQTIAIGDGANDIPMLNVAALGVAFHAKPKVQAQAKAAIRHGSLLQLLYLID